MAGSRKRRCAVACLLLASLVACFVALGHTTSPRSVTVRSLPPRVAAGKANCFWAAVEKAASSNKTDAETYVGKIAGWAKAHIDSGKVVDREPQIEALVQSMSQKGLLTLVLGGKNLGKTLLKGEAIHRCADRKDKINVLSVDMRDASLAGRPLMAALDLERQKSLKWITRAVQGFRAVIAQMQPVDNKAISMGTGAAAKDLLDLVIQEKQVNIENFINQTVRSGRIPSIVVDEAKLALPGISGEANTAAKTALATITKWTKQTKQANFMLISSEFGYPFRLLECSLNLQDIGKVIVIGEVPKDDMLQMLTSDWGMDDNLANVFYDYFGGDISTTKQALDQLVEGKEKFDPEAVVDCPGLPTCVKDPEARAHLENIAKDGFSLVEDVETDAGARMIAQKNVGGVIRKGAVTFGLPDIFTSTGYKYAVIPSSNHMRWLAARTLENIPLPGPRSPWFCCFMPFFNVHCSISIFATKFEHRVGMHLASIALRVSPSCARQCEQDALGEAIEGQEGLTRVDLPHQFQPRVQTQTKDSAMSI